MNGGLFYHVLLVLVFTVLLAVTLCEGYDFKCGMAEVYCPKTDKCENVILTDCKGKCDSFEASCDNNTNCYTSFDRCDGTRHCNDGVDESHCRGCNSAFELPCDDGSCYRKYKNCDGYTDCSDGSDEKNCPSNCWSLTCNNGDCYNSGDKCDGVSDCSDGTDEQYCPDSSSDSSSSSGIGGLSSGAIAGIVVGAVCLAILVACCKKAMRDSGSEVTTVGSGSAAYHSAANYRQNENFQSTHHYNNGSTYYPPAQTDAAVRQPTENAPYPVSLGGGAPNPAAEASPFQSTHNYNNNTGSSIPPLPPNFAQPTAPAAGLVNDGANRDYGTAPYPPYPAPDPAPVAAPPPSYDSLYPENK